MDKPLEHNPIIVSRIPWQSKMRQGLPEAMLQEGLVSPGGPHQVRPDDLGRHSCQMLAKLGPGGHYSTAGPVLLNPPGSAVSWHVKYCRAAWPRRRLGTGKEAVQILLFLYLNH